MEKFNITLKRLRKENKLTQQELAKNLGLKNCTISAWEKGRNQPNIEMLTKIADFFNININELFDYPTENEYDFLKGLEGIKLSEYKQLDEEAKKTIREQFNTLVDFASKK